METLIIIFLAVLLLIAGFVFWMWRSNVRMKNNASVTAVVEFPVDAPPTVMLTPSDADDLTIVKLSLLHIAKIEHVLQDSPEGIGEFYRQILRDLSPSPKQGGQSNLFTSISHFLDQMEKRVRSEGLLRANGKLEKYVAWLYEGRTSFVNTELPMMPRGLAVNIPISALLVANYVAERISRANLAIFEAALCEYIEMVSNTNRKFGLMELREISLTGFQRAQERATSNP